MTDEQRALGNAPEIEITSEMEASFIDYAMTVIVSRALPDVRDGLKPVQRRIIYSMFENNISPTSAHRKCAKVVGEVMGNYHPHGDQAIYDALVRMGQDFSMRHLLIDPQGNFGTVDDPPGAARYTECRSPSCRCDSSRESTRTRSISTRTTTARARSRRFSRADSPIFWSMVPRGSRWAWPPTSRHTTSAR